MNIDESINSWTFEETIKVAENLMEVEKNLFKWDVIRHLRDFAENYREQLKEYQQLEEQGRLVSLPCKIGDTVYCIFNRYTKCTFSNEEFDEYNCQGCEYECDSKKENYVQDVRAYSLDWIVTNLNNFGKTVFLTQSEAEAKLKELRGNND